MAAHRETGFPITIVRPSHTYDTIVPVAVGKSDYTILDRIRRGKPVIVHGEGTSLWTLTHADDFGARVHRPARQPARRSATRSTSPPTNG